MDSAGVILLLSMSREGVSVCVCDFFPVIVLADCCRGREVDGELRDELLVNELRA